MVELLSTMWIYLAGAGAIGLILGWAFRGAFLPRPKSINVEVPVREPRDTELSNDQKQALERAEKADAAVADLEARLKETAERDAQLQAEINQAKFVIDELEAQLNAASQSAPASAESAAEADETDAQTLFEDDQSENDDEAVTFTNDPALEWREKYLKARVYFLEDQLKAAKEDAESSDMAKPEAEPMSAPEPMVVPVAEPIADPVLVQELETAKARLAEVEPVLKEVPDLVNKIERLHDELERAHSINDALKAKEHAQPATSETPQLGRLKWQNRYLQARITHLEANASSVETEAALPVPKQPAPLPVANNELAELKAELARMAAADGSAEQELTKLRWRNRYLEGRVKYLEAAALDEESDADDSVLPAEASATPVTIVEDGEPADDIPEEEGVFEQDAFVDDSEEVRPPSLDTPRGGKPDDLKKIGGIGPKIEGILHELGIFHFDQIANWSKGETQWIDNYLRFQGRVQQEDWVEQARDLGSSNASS